MERLSRNNYKDELIFDPGCIAMESLYWHCPNISRYNYNGGIGLIILENWVIDKMTIPEIAKFHQISTAKVRKLLREGAEVYKIAEERLAERGVVGVNIPAKFDAYHLMVEKKLRSKEGNRLIKDKCRDIRKLSEFTQKEFLEEFKGWRLSFKSIYKIMDELGIQFKS